MDKNSLYKMIPKVDSLIEDSDILLYFNHIDHNYIIMTIREALDNLRNDIKEIDDINYLNKSIASIKENICFKLDKLIEPNLKRVINCTGIVVHTNLGRSVLSEEIFNEIKEKLTHYTNLEYNLQKGERGSRYDLVEYLLCHLTGAEAALVVNNNAAAVILAVNTLSLGKEAIVSRGELVEIGGSFRIPEVMKLGGATLIEVGTTNKTHLKDFADAITENTAIILKVHTSNYKIIGFSKDVDVEELVELGKEKKVLVIEDLGSGMMFDYFDNIIHDEPTIKESLKKGVDILTFSGDKLLGGPQAGIILGKKNLIDKMKSNQLTRALRVDKFTLSALEAILRKYLRRESAIKEIPTLRLLNQSLEDIEERAKELYSKLEKQKYKNNISIDKCFSKIGGGSMPEINLESYAVIIKPVNMKTSQFEEKLRKLEIPIISRISDEKIILDMRTVFDDDIDILASELCSL
jgi:L-seryl-tRNA(Ser) seleniumtransferase